MTMASITPGIGFGGFSKLPITTSISPLTFGAISPFSLGFGGVSKISPFSLGFGIGFSPFGFGFRGFNPLGFGFNSL